MPSDLKQAIKKEMFVGALISAFISAFFVFAIFGNTPDVALWGGNGAAFDFLPQTFMLSLMSALIPALVIRRKIMKGKLEAVAGNTWGMPRQVIIRSLLMALITTPLGSIVGVAAIATIASDTVNFSALLIVKVLYGAAIAAVVARQSVKLTSAHAWNSTLQGTHKLDASDSLTRNMER